MTVSCLGSVVRGRAAEQLHRENLQLNISVIFVFFVVVFTDSLTVGSGVGFCSEEFAIG